MVVFLKHSVGMFLFVPSVQAKFPDGVFTRIMDLDHPRTEQGGSHADAVEDVVVRVPGGKLPVTADCLQKAGCGRVNNDLTDVIA